MGTRSRSFLCPRVFWAAYLCRAAVRAALFCVLLITCGAGCDSEPLRIAVLMPMTPGGGGRPAMEFAMEGVNAAGGVAGRKLALEYVSYDSAATTDDLQTLAMHVVSDDKYVAAIGPASSAQLIAIADTFQKSKKPLVSFTSSSAEVLRAYGGKGFIWRTRESDIAQTELLVRYASAQGAKRLALLTSVGADGYTFFSWFGFFAQDLGYTEDRIHIGAFDGTSSCDAVVKSALATQPDLLFLAAGTTTELECVVRATRVSPTTRIIVADTGLDTPGTLRQLGTLADGIEGFSPVSAGAPSFDDSVRARLGMGADVELPPHGPSEYDAVLLLAYGLQMSSGQGGDALVSGIKAAVDGRDGSYSWNVEGITSALAAMRQGQRPNISGATGGLEFEPGLYTDLADSTVAHWVFRGGRRSFAERYYTGAAEFRTAQGALVRNGASSALDLSASGSAWTPKKDKGELWAVIAALSSGWSNYRHQADALRQYQILRKNGVPDDHIVLVLADDVAASNRNPLPGTVRNEAGGADLRAGAQVDYNLALSPTQLMDIIAGRSSATTPTVVNTTDASNLYVYFVGHGGQTGMPLRADTTSDGVSGSDATLVSPALMRQTLCELQTTGRLRRGLVILESCFSGSFGVSKYSGLDIGCDGMGGTPLGGVVLLTAANSTEASFAASYDSTVGAWLADQFSLELARLVEVSPAASLSELYRMTYLGVPGSHVSIYNTRNAGQLSGVSISEFFSP